MSKQYTCKLVEGASVRVVDAESYNGLVGRVIHISGSVYSQGRHMVMIECTERFDLTDNSPYIREIYEGIRLNFWIDQLEVIDE